MDENNNTNETVLFLSGNTNNVVFTLDNTINNVTSIEILRTNFTQSEKTVEEYRQFPFLILSNWYPILQQLNIDQNVLENITNTSIDVVSILNSSLTSYYLPLQNNFNFNLNIIQSSANPCVYVPKIDVYNYSLSSLLTQTNNVLSNLYTNQTLVNYNSSPIYLYISLCNMNTMETSVIQISNTPMPTGIITISEFYALITNMNIHDGYNGIISMFVQNDIVIINLDNSPTFKNVPYCLTFYFLFFITPNFPIITTIMEQFFRYFSIRSINNIIYSNNPCIIQNFQVTDNHDSIISINLYNKNTYSVINAIYFKLTINTVYSITSFMTLLNTQLSTFGTISCSLDSNSIFNINITQLKYNNHVYSTTDYYLGLCLPTVLYGILGFNPYLQPIVSFFNMYYDTPSVNNILYSSIAVSPIPNITMSLDTTQNIYTFSAPYPFIIYPFEGSELYGLQRDYLMIAQKPPSCIPTTLSNAYSIQCVRSPNLDGPNIIYIQCDEWINNKLFHSTIYDRLFGEIILNSDENYVEQTSFTKKTNVTRPINNIKKLNKLNFKFYSDRNLTQLYMFNGKQWDMELLLQYTNNTNDKNKMIII